MKTFIPRAQEIYRHFKGNLYQIVTVAEHTETGEEMVVYQAMYGEFKVYVRPLKMFCSKVDKEKYPDVKQEYRFELQETWGRGCEYKDDVETIEPEAAVGNMDVFEEAEAVVESVDTTKNSMTESQASAEAIEEPELDPMLLAFLDAESYKEKLSILAGMHHRITDDMITVMAIASDIEIEEGDLESRYSQLKNCLLTLDKYEITRL
ncbi:MAG: DUF1653 domain-containing protein [Lachnospiraceae bacterium]|nr:DUF1653 domain-containing protein [Lachnospiraceae bacterium]